MNQESAKRRIEKLMAMAHDGRGNEFEAEIALKQAETLMRKHGIDVAMLADRTNTKPVYEWRTVLVPEGAPTPVTEHLTWVGTLAVGIAYLTDTKVTNERHPMHGHCIKIQGDAHDVEFAVWLMKHLRDDARRQSAKFVGTRREREDFRRAYSARVQQRCKQMRREREEALRAQPTSTGTALVVVNQKLALRDQQFGRFTTHNNKGRCYDRSAYDAGHAAGDRAGLARPIAQQQHKQLN